MVDRNNCPTLGVCYYPEHWPENNWKDQAQQMADLGLTYVRIGEFAWSRMEPNPGSYDFDWLKRSMDILGDAGLKVVLGTPTATPPKWLVDSMPDMVPIDVNGHNRKFGSRRHYDFSHQGYREECVRIVTKLAESVGDHKALAVWQTDNEYSCHDTTLSYSSAAKEAYQIWLVKKYGSVDALNVAWGNVFWSMEYRSFAEIDLPNLAVTEVNPSHALSFRKFSSDQVVSFNALQTEIIRDLSPGRDIVHNFMAKTTDFDHFKVSESLDIASWDSYPLGNLERTIIASDRYKEKYLRQGDPDFQAFHHDLYRGCKQRWWVMEQQPGPVNWADWNPAPLNGMVRLWSWEAIAHGAETVSYFRWQQAPFAQEQMHAGLNRPDGQPAQAFFEAKQVAAEIKKLGVELTKTSPDVALIFDYESIWAGQVQPQGQDFDPWEICFVFYKAARQLGFSIDIVPAGADLTAYKLVLMPSLMHVSDAAMTSLRQTKAHLVIGPRCGSKTEDLTIPPNLAPGVLKEFAPLTVECLESLRPGISVATMNGDLVKWREHVSIDTTAHDEGHLLSVDGRLAVAHFERASYLAGWPDNELIISILEQAAKSIGLNTLPMSGGIRQREFDKFILLMNYGSSAEDISSYTLGKKTVLGDAKSLKPADIAIIEK